ncbi:MAG: DUF4157 domain-containing protein [bacterium]|nr:DUF4157 domain-containing protein [bacterium]
MPEPRLSSSVGDSSLANSTIPHSGTIQRVCAPCSEEYNTAADENRPVEPANLSPKCRTREEGLIQTKQITPLIQRQENFAEEEDEELIQAKIAGDVTPEVTPTISSGIQSLQDGGRPLAGSERSFFEPRFGADFSKVRVHNDTQAANVARSVNARAFTLGRNVVFGAGEYSPDASSGRKLLAHELTHVVQQNGGSTLFSAGKDSGDMIPNSKELSIVSREYVVQHGANGRAGHYSPDRTNPLEVTRINRDVIQRARLPVAQIRSDIEQGKTTHPDLLSWIQILGEQTGHIAHAANFPGGRSLTSMPSPVPAPDPQPIPIVSQWPIEAYFFPAHVQHTDQRALIMGGYHGDERPGYEMVEAFRDRVRQGQVPLAFHTLVIPRINRGAIEDDQAGVTWYDRRGNRQFVDLNRNYRVPGAPAPSFSSRCPNTHLAPIQPETQGVIDVIQGFSPHRILSGHAISRPARAGIFADPNTHPTATQLALAMAGRLPHSSDRPANLLGTRAPNAVYPGDRPGNLPSEPSLGRYAPTASRPGHMIPVITVEAPRYGSLAATGARSREGYAGALTGFVAEPSTLADADLQIVRTIQAMTIANRRLFLTGRMASTVGIYRRIRGRINNAVRQLNRLRPRPSVSVREVSGRRAFGTRIGRASPQAQIVFEKFTLTGGRVNGWDTLPNQYYLGGNRSRGVDRATWLAEPSARRLQIILQFSAVPGASRHHWGTDVDFNSTTNSDWAPSPGPGRPAGQFHSLGQWLEQNGPRVGFFRTYTAGRTGGHAPEPWHYSYEPIASPLRAAYNRDIRLQQDIVDPIMHDWRSRPTVAGVTLPTDLRAALLALDLSQYVNQIGPGL